MSEKKAAWLARRFDLVGLSCDGPTDIQNEQRPLWGGGATARNVEQTAHILQAEGQRVHVRATVTRESVQRQAEITEYVCEKLKPEEIHMEPVYTGGRAGVEMGLGPLEAMDFVDHFLEARRNAQVCGVKLVYAGCRLDQLHGPYCNVSREVLNLVPGGVATACFKVTDGKQARARGMSIGEWEGQSGRFVIDQDRVRELQRWLISTPIQCEDCFNQYHCARECPDGCSLGTGSVVEGSSGGFRCQVQKGIAAATLEEVAEAVWSRVTVRGENGSGHGRAVL
jgi:sulfatase maturation enzyme AslB (radical SAM superfamily)